MQPQSKTDLLEPLSYGLGADLATTIIEEADRMEITDLSQSIGDLSPEEDALPERRLKEIGFPAPGAPAIHNRDRSAPCPLSFAQQRLWFLDQMEPNSCVYNIATAARLRGDIHVSALREALDAVVARHEVLRSAVIASDDEPLQVVAERWSMELPVIDLSGAPDAEREAGLERVLRAEARQPFNLAAGLMLRAMLVRLAKRDHVLLLTTHHIASDGWSMGVLTRELTAFYEAISQGDPPTLPPLPMQYGDYAVWQRQWLQGAELAKHVDYWKGRLAGAPPMLPLPTDRPRPAAQTYEGAQESLGLSRGLTDALHALSSRERATLFMTLLGAFQTLLHRYTGQDDVVLGTAIAGRRRVETEPLIGFFVNTLVLRTDMSGDPSFRQFLGRVRETVLGAYDHQDLPFEKLVDEVRPERSLSWAPLFQVMFVLEDADQPSLELPGLTVSPAAVDTGTAMFDLTASVTEGPQGLSVTLEYNTDLYDAATVRRMLGHYEMLLQGIVADPEQRLSQFPLLTAAERHQVLVEWNATQAPYPADACIHGLFEAQVRRTPEAVAVVFEDKRLTYQELNHRANQVAHRLRSLGVGPEVPVGIYAERSLDRVIGLLGILKAGGAYVPLHPAHPRERVARILQDVRPAVIVTQQGLADRLGGTTVHMMCLDADGTAPESAKGTDPESGATPEDLAYIMYTSGSTGRPKGVQVSHRSVINLLEALRPLIQFGERDVWTGFHSYTFDFSVWEIWGCLLSGGRLVIVPRAIARSPGALCTLLREEQVTILNQTPSGARQLVDAVSTNGRLATGLALRTIICGGEALPRELAAQLLAWDTPVWNFYGPTEATVWATVDRIRSGEPKDGTASIGRPIANIQAYILNAALQPVPVGVAGELHIGGVGLARGYVDQPAETAEKFIPHPFSTEPGARLYKTGDLARFRPDGNIEFLGRLDHQVKIRGFRAELGEIEAALTHHPAVRAAVALVREDAPGEKRLVAYIVPHQEPAVTTSDLRHFLKRTLPDYMIPAHFMMLDTLPLTPNGKVDRRRLPAPGAAHPVRDAGYVRPENPLEQQLVQIWEEYLDVRPIGTRDDFFELGGHSLLAVRTINAIEREVGRRLPLSTLFTGATIHELAQAILQQPPGAHWSPVTMMHPEGSRLPFFFLSGDYDGGGFYCLTMSRVLGPEQPFFVLHPHGIDGRPVPESIEAMATDYLATVRALQPQGPYLLGGYCNGGVVAFEMARRLQGLGERVDLLVLLDTPAYNTRFSVRILHGLVNGVGALGRLTPQERLEHFARLRQWIGRLRGSSLADRVALLRRMARRGGEELAGMFWWRGKRPARSRLESLNKIYDQAISGYIPRRYAGRITVLCSGDSWGGRPELRWRAVAPEVEVHMVPGDHQTCITEHAVVLGELLGVCLQNVQPK